MGHDGQAAHNGIRNDVNTVEDSNDAYDRLTDDNYRRLKYVHIGFDGVIVDEASVDVANNEFVGTYDD